MIRTSLWRRILAISTAVLLFSVQPIIMAASTAPERFTFTLPWNEVLPAGLSCSGEAVQITGTLVISIESVSSSATTLSTIHVQPFLTATSASGAQYEAVGPDQTVEVDGRSTVFSFVNVVRLISSGSAGNLVLTGIVHVTVDANGVPTAWFESTSGGCRG